MRMKMLLGGLSVFLIAVGCSGSPSDLSKSDESTLRTNINRELTPEEIKHMNSAPAGDPTALAAKPPPGKMPRN